MAGFDQSLPPSSAIPNAVRIDNDTRGWIMCVCSAVACVAGASIICVDVLIRYIPSKKNFRIEDSKVFLAASLSLSFGVMVRLYSSMLFEKMLINRRFFRPCTVCSLLQRKHWRKEDCRNRKRHGHYLVVLLVGLLAYKSSRGSYIGTYLPMSSTAIIATTRKPTSMD